MVIIYGILYISLSEMDPLNVSLSTDQAHSLLGSEVSNVPSFLSGFESASASVYEQVPQQQAIGASSSRKKNQHSSSKKYQKDSRSSKSHRKSSKRWLKNCDQAKG